MEKTLKWWQKEVTWGFFIKLMITLNLFAICFSFRLAYISDLEEEEEQEYIQQLEDRIELQSELIELQWRVIDGEGLRQLNEDY